MKKAVIHTGGKQYLVQEGDVIEVELLKNQADKKKLTFEPLLVIDGESVRVGAPLVADSTVSAELLEEDLKADKVTSIRYKAKKRVHTVRGHRQRHSVLKVTKIA